jgi:hypothetical protein
MFVCILRWVVGRLWVGGGVEGGQGCIRVYVYVWKREGDGNGAVREVGGKGTHRESGGHRCAALARVALTMTMRRLPSLPRPLPLLAAAVIAVTAVAVARSVLAPGTAVGRKTQRRYGEPGWDGRRGRRKKKAQRKSGKGAKKSEG